MKIAETHNLCQNSNIMMLKRVFLIFLAVMAFFSVTTTARAEESDYEGSYNSNADIHPYSLDEMNRFILRKEDLTKENLCYTIREIMEQAPPLYDEFIDCVFFRENGHLGISVFIGFDPLKDLYGEEISQVVMTRLTNELLSYPELDKYWNKITFLTEAGSIVLTRDMIRTDERGRYFNAVFRYDMEYYYDYIADVIR